MVNDVLKNFTDVTVVKVIILFVTCLRIISSQTRKSNIVLLNSLHAGKGSVSSISKIFWKMGHSRARKI